MTGGLGGPTIIFPGRSDSLDAREDSLSALADALDFLGISRDPVDHLRTPLDNSRSIFLALPAEIRNNFYASALRDDNNELALLRTCQQVNMEALPTLYQRPVSFSSQSKLFTWIERSRENDLKRVRTLSLRLTDIDLSPLLDPAASRRSSEQSAWSLYQRELERLDGALRCLPGIEQLTIVPPNRMQSSLLRGIYLSFLNQLPIRCPKLKHLTLHDSEELLNKAPGLNGISKIMFEAPTPSSSPNRSPSSQEKQSAMRGKAREVVVKMEIDEDDL